MHKKSALHITRWTVLRTLLAFSTSFLFIWSIGYFFCDSLIAFQFDPVLQQFIHLPKTMHKVRSEGYGKTYKGYYGINGIEDITKDSREKIVIWGDSYVEAHQVNDEDKISQVINRQMAEEQLDKQFMSFSVGMSGDSLADYYFNIPKYEKLTRNTITSHYILITHINDTLPDQVTDTLRGVFTSNPFFLSNDSWKPQYQNIKRTLNAMGMYFIWRPITESYAKINTLKARIYVRKTPVASGVKQKENYSKAFLTDAWSFLFARLRKQTENSIVIIYAPITPYIEDGKVYFQDRDDAKIALLTEIAEESNIQVINATEYLNDFYKEKGLFPRGFSNSEPGYGHFNEYGNTIVGDIIFHRLRNRLSH